MDADNQTILEDIFRAVFELDETDRIESIKRNNFPAWDSMAHVALISAIDDEFDLIMDTQDALRIDSLASCISVVERYLN